MVTSFSTYILWTERFNMNKKITALFILSGLMNIVGVLLFSWCFQNTDLGKLDPMFSQNGLIAVMVLGLFYMGAGFIYHIRPLIILLFGVVKFCYAINWYLWWNNPLGLYQTLEQYDLLTVLFFQLYGPLDFLVGCFFVGVYIVQVNKTKSFKFQRSQHWL